VYHRNSSSGSEVIESDIRALRKHNPSAENLNRCCIAIFMSWDYYYCNYEFKIRLTVLTPELDVGIDS
jgi:hypothetical protein